MNEFVGKIKIHFEPAPVPQNFLDQTHITGYSR